MGQPCPASSCCPSLPALPGPGVPHLDLDRAVFLTCADLTAETGRAQPHSRGSVVTRVTELPCKSPNALVAFPVILKPLFARSVRLGCIRPYRSKPRGSSPRQFFVAPSRCLALRFSSTTRSISLLFSSSPSSIARPCRSSLHPSPPGRSFSSHVLPPSEKYCVSNLNDLAPNLSRLAGTNALE